MGKSISPGSIYEGGDVYFDCLVDASPKPHKILWFQDVSITFYLKRSEGGPKGRPSAFSNCQIKREKPGTNSTAITQPLQLLLTLELLHSVFLLIFFVPNAEPRFPRKQKVK